MKIFPLIFILIFNQGCIGAMVFLGIVSAGHEIIQDGKIDKLEKDLEKCHQSEVKCVT